ncbi:MAG: hypothetical protein KatS3mg095_0151 [Candidatus Parcubacteria bacterium]|nr:MAG: hypothetical protein KatS3mg095_0151 [Candidatus Parcubacteria bacterium]
MKNKALLFFLIFIFLPFLTFAQYYYFPPVDQNQDQNQEGDNNQFFGNFNFSTNIQPFIFSPTGSSYAFIYPDLSSGGQKIRVSRLDNYGIRTAEDFGPFVFIIWYGFSNRGDYAIIGITSESSQLIYKVILNGNVIYSINLPIL